MNVPQDLLYTKEHEWIRVEGNSGRMGITDYAQSSLGDITFVELPKLDNTVKQADCCASVESVKAASDIYAPLSGKIVKVNEELNNHPELINQSAYENGWLAVIEIKDAQEKEKLMNASQYSEYVKGLSK